MLVTKKLDLSRFKKSSQGIKDFANLIEQAEPTQRNRIVEQAEEQDAEFVYKVMKKVIFFEELVYLDDSILAEILSKTSPKVLAYALCGAAPELRTKLLEQTGFQIARQIKDEEDRFTTEGLAAGLILGAQKQILKTGRAMENIGKFTFELTDCPRFRKKTKVAAAG